jgi:hypothetical protein
MDVGKCSICLSNFTTSDMAVLRHCMHTFHRECIDEAVRTRPECPICRNPTQLEHIATPFIDDKKDQELEDKNEEIKVHLLLGNLSQFEI